METFDARIHYLPPDKENFTTKEKPTTDANIRYNIKTYTS